MERINHQVRLASRPVGTPQPDVWQHTEEPVPEPAEGQLLVRVSHLSLDPAMRGWMNEGRSYVPPVQIGEVMRALGAGEVLASRHPRFNEGDRVPGRSVYRTTRCPTARACSRSTRRPRRCPLTCPPWG